MPSTSHFLINEGQEGDVLGCWEPGPQDMQEGDLSHLSALWNSLVQLEHFSTPIHESYICPYS